MVVTAGPFSITSQCTPTAVSTATVVLVWGIALDGGGGTLPQHRVGGVPSCTKLELLQVGKTDIAAIDIDDVEEQTCCP